MKGEILDIDTVQEIARNEKELERLRRDRNFFEMEKKRLEKELDKVNQKNIYLEGINEIFETVQSYLPHRMKQISDKNDSRCEYAVLELKKLSDAIADAKAMLLNKEVEDET